MYNVRNVTTAISRMSQYLAINRACYVLDSSPYMGVKYITLYIIRLSIPIQYPVEHCWVEERVLYHHHSPLNFSKYVSQT